MANSLDSIRTLRSAIANESMTPLHLISQALSRSNGTPHKNTYLWQDQTWTIQEADRVASMPARNGGLFGDGRGTVWGLPVSVKDCFDLGGAPTSCGVRFYRELNGIAARDSWIVETLRSSGAIITGKTHLHPLAYGITGENPEFGDCLQPRKPHTLTGGSSSGAAASILEGSAVAAIGTDTGGSIRVPAALCGLAGYRASLGRGDWRGAGHLAPSFDTLGWVFRHLEDAPLLAWPFVDPQSGPIRTFSRFAFVEESFLQDCDPDVLDSYRTAIRELESLGLESFSICVPWWDDAMKIFAPIQACEAAEIHRGHFDHFEPAIRGRLAWGATMGLDELSTFRKEHIAFRERMDDLFSRYDLVLMPAAPVADLIAGADHSSTRARLLRYTTPFSLAGVPAITIPCDRGGVQLAAGRNQDESLLEIGGRLGASRKGIANSK